MTTGMKPVYLTFFGHLEELRRRILTALAAVGVAAVGGYFISERLLDFLTRPLGASSRPLYFFSPQEAFLVRLKIALFFGLVAASPVVIAQAWLFVSPALYGNERKAVAPLVVVTSVLFLTGIVFAYYLVMPVALQFLLGMQTGFLVPMISVTDYLSFLTAMLLAFGIAFNMPVFVMAFVVSGVWSARDLNRYQRHAVVLIFILAAVMTPGPDIASQLLLALPLVALFELSVLAAVIFGKKK